MGRDLGLRMREATVGRRMTACIQNFVSFCATQAARHGIYGEAGLAHFNNRFLVVSLAIREMTSAASGKTLMLRREQPG